ncbi:hypothetical protein [Saccharothrix violaceirubra]|uniref:Uncharacterized protein n=1 Tax=Saccharothrix violaceirubra TaxID=413306 RepID=A0A7W7T845_9PSEU|nr:hypothetical protein [Saccharothrix violaceirubra]MBB4968324.1 hypothetical protein [Saccharothrix violaceirubra]
MSITTSHRPGLAITGWDLRMVSGMARHRVIRLGRRLFRRRPADDLLSRSIRSCPGCAADVHVFADVCRHCGGELEIVAA